MINIDDCIVACAAQGGWSLVDRRDHVQAFLPDGFAANEAAAKPMLRLIAESYNRGFGQCGDAIRTRLDRLLADLPTNGVPGGAGEGG